ncbi:hypothetical protein B7463_g7685, partial [Scytalidium lignicola]
MSTPNVIESPVGPEVLKLSKIQNLPAHGPVQFDPVKHLAFSPPSSILTMQDLGFEPTALSAVATTTPFPFLSHEALRGMAPRYAPFIHQFWHSPEVLKIVSDLAGVELVPAMDYEISHTNIQLGAGGVDAVRRTPVEPPIATEEGIRQFEEEKPKNQVVTDQTAPIVEWHRDSHPWVVVVMLSDARYMTGGETELMKGDRTTLKVKAPQMGCAVLLQGKYITHTAAPVTNMPERITIVTSFRPKDPTLLDETTNANVRNKSHFSELYYQWTTYRLAVLAERARLALDDLRKRYDENVKNSDPKGKAGLCRVETVNVADVEKWANEQIKYIQQTLYEMRPLGQ